MRKLRIPSLAISALLLSSVATGQSVQSQIDPSAILKNMQQQSAQLAALWLHSPEPRLQAWGAFFVLRDRLTQFSHDLLALVSAHQVVEKDYKSPDSDEHDAMVAVLDAVIQLNIKIPVPELVRLYPEFPAETLLLLSRFNPWDNVPEEDVLQALLHPSQVNPGDNVAADDATHALLHIFEAEKSWSNAWLAAGDLLASRRAPGFAALVLKGMVIHLDVSVTSPNSGGGFGSGGSCCSFGFNHEPRKGWPEVGNYQLFDCGTPRWAGATVLASGREPAYYVRTVDGLYGYGSAGSCGCGVERNLVRQHFLETLLYQDDENAPVKAKVSERIEWRDSDAYVSEIQEFVQAQRDAIAQVVKELQDKHLLTSEEAAAVAPKIEIQIHDFRHGDRTPIPPLPSLGSNVSVTKVEH